MESFTELVSFKDVLFSCLQILDKHISAAKNYPSELFEIKKEIITTIENTRKFVTYNQIKTNGDKIRNMCDEELSEFLTCPNPCESHCEFYNKCHENPDCAKGILDWLKKELADG